VTGTARVSLTNAAGIKVYNFEKQIIKGETRIVINDKNLAASIYFLRVEFPGVVKVIPVIRTRN